MNLLTKITKLVAQAGLISLLFISLNANSSMRPNGLSNHVFKLALQAYQCASSKGQIRNPMLSIVDYSLPSTKARFWVIDMNHQKVLYHLYVAHGRNSGKLYAKYFSNTPGSLASSLGAFIANETYSGQHGYSLYLDGLEPGINDKARARHIIVHGAPYVSKQFAVQNNYMGRSWGCLALNPQKVSKVINKIKGGSLIFAYGPGIEKDPYLKTCH